jgi:hypothetical protein
MNKNYIIAALIVVILIVVSSVLFCCSFRPIWIKDIPDECNMSLNVYKMYYKTADKSAIVPITDACVKKLHRLYCQSEVFGIDESGKPRPVLYDDPKLYRNYGQCLSEIK